MTGPEHYQAAEELLLAADAYDQDGAPQTAAQRRAEAQVHATLAQVALTAQIQPVVVQNDEQGLSQDDYDEWFSVAHGLNTGAGEQA